MEGIQLAKHESWQYASDVNQICADIFSEFQFSYFDYARFYDDGRYVILYSNREWAKYFLTHPLFVRNNPISTIAEGEHLWAEYIDDSFLIKANTNFNLFHGVTLYSIQNGFKEIVNFSAPAVNRQVLNIYLNKKNLLYSFKSYFIEKAEKLLKRIEYKPQIIFQKDKIFTQEKSAATLTNSSEDWLLNKFTSINSSKNINSLYEKLSKAAITNREQDCLNLLLKGFTSKIIGKKLNLSYRTVETHIDSIRKKFNCKSRIELVSLFIS